MSEDFIKILVIIVIISFLIYYVMVTLKKYGMIEGLENMQTENTSDNETSNEIKLPIGAAANANTYEKQLKNIVAKLNDVFLIKKYRKDYENIVIDMDDLVNVLMLKTVLDTPLNDDPESVIRQIKLLNELNSAKTSLNNVMKFIDKS